MRAFILLTRYGLADRPGRVRVHPIQYLMLGGRSSLYPLVSPSEHPLPATIPLASTSIIAMVGLRRGSLQPEARFTVAAGVALLYGYPTSLLMNEDYALIGSIGSS